MKMQVLTVVGARPQFIKASTVSPRLRRHAEEVLVHTGQHYDAELSDVFFETLDVPTPDYNLDVGSAPHGRQTARMMVGIEELLEKESPDVVLVYGDTNSTLAGALIAAKTEGTLAHVEAGLRSFDPRMAEEINRVITDHVSDLLFPPSDLARRNLRAEGIDDGVHLVGDVMYDTLRWARDRLPASADLDIGLPEEGYVLATLHRARNTDDPDRLATILRTLSAAPKPVVFPVHPRTSARIDEYGLRNWLDDIKVFDPVGYPEFLRLLEDADRVVTDSGGVQKEAFFLETPCITLRERTEWVETVWHGWNVLVGADKRDIRWALAKDFEQAERPPVYGDGNAADRIVEVLRDVA
jgi:UDP-N-acetylglucosamine 2-epimerase